MKISLNNVFEYFIVLFTIILSGSIIPYAYFSSYTTLLLILLLILLIFPLLKKKKYLFRKINFNNFLFFLFVSIYLILQFFLKREFEYLKEYMGYYIRCMIGILIALQINKREYLKKFTDIVYILCIISLFFYLFGLMYPNSIKILPLIIDDAKVNFRYALVYVYQGSEFWNFRNAGIFWEPGAFQVFINLSLIFNFFYFKEKFSKKNIILIVTGITTLSTIAFLVLLCLCGIKIFQYKSKLKYLFIIVSIIVFSQLEIMSSLIYDKIFRSNISKGDRIAGQTADLILFMKKPLFGVGYHQYALEFKEIALSLGAVAPNSSNSYTVILALYGIIQFSIIIFSLFMFFNTITKNKSEKIIIFLSLILMLSTEGFLTKLLFLIFMFYGSQSIFLKKINKDVINKNEFKSIYNNSNL